MALFTVTDSRGFTSYLSINETSYNIADNTSTVSYSYYLYAGTQSFSQYGIAWNIVINGVTVQNHAWKSAEYTCRKGTTMGFGSGTTTITHDNDGSKSIYCYATITRIDGTQTYTPIVGTRVSGTVVLTTIPRTSTLAVAPEGYAGRELSINIVRYDESYIDKLTYDFVIGSTTIKTNEVIVNRTQLTEVPLTIPTSFFDGKTEVVGTLTIKVQTYTSDSTTLVADMTNTATITILKPAADVEGIQLINISTNENIYPVPQIPVGTIIYMYDGTSPATIYGYEWEQITNKFILACNTTYPNLSTGGEATHTLIANEVARHTHTFPAGNPNDRKGTMAGMYLRCNATSSARTIYTNYVGGGGAHNNMPPYIRVSAWRRI